MPPMRTASATKPPKPSERTHEENQERAYIAASRRSDRSIEARVESARRASEIHKKRTGRSLRVREEDVQNEEMYEEEDDDFPMQYRRINALFPGQSPLDNRLNSFLSSQIGMRSYLHQAMYEANQNTIQHRYYNQVLQQQQQQQQQHGNPGMLPSPPQSAAQPWSPPQSALPTGPSTILRTESFTIDTAQQQVQSPTFTMPDARSMSLSLPSPGSRRHASNASASQLPLQPNTASQPAPTHRYSSSSSCDNSDPLSMALPFNSQQLLDGHPAFPGGIHPSQMTSGVPMPSTYNYQFDPLSKANNAAGVEKFAFGQRDLSQTLSPQQMHLADVSTMNNMHIKKEELNELSESSWVDNDDLFDFGQFGQFCQSGQATPGEFAWSPEDYLEHPNAT